ncbi:hypothetical protein A3A68_00365 [Candidatus Saccharibacteria bacterium RIFCSPLOWO2_01_FULL_48_13]|nr:MAG: hypothetical protein A2884_00860 [Candidatus Saccharibacteria bacterium RIFCSPHIGHO2_01_FULL_48_12]OGL36115.1 MAG: hypothetical protein A3F38_02735 [Candidatus Saccharibacteria bacterium RIFCSPHIGHO2_12_FULL_48_21]OGL36687.1 MAG: hypothetical protein A3A68_00365 [Candidatus Saccharibacteria bacterium RIFCSPLOWO2_01_FULL_48_13]
MEWLKQGSEPLFPDLLWSRPENKATAGRLLIIGGNSQGFRSPANAFMAAHKAGIGSLRVILPDKLRKSVSKLFPEAIFAPSTLSGSFAKTALAQSIEEAKWADGVLLAGDFGKNSETAVFLETFLSKYAGRVVLAGDGVDNFQSNPNVLFSRKNSALVVNFGVLQALSKKERPDPPLTSSMSLYELVNVLGQWSKEIPTALITSHQGSTLVAFKGKVSTTPVKSVNMPELAAYIVTWWIQQSNKTFESITSAVWECNKSAK